MKMRNMILLAVMSGAVLASCAMIPSRGESSGVFDERVMESPSMAGQPEMLMEEAKDSAIQDSDFTSTGGTAERIVIRNASLSLVVEDPTQAAEDIARMAEARDGFVVSSNVYKTTTNSGLEVPNANITVRVPADQLEETLKQIKALVGDARTDIQSEEVSGQDVTSEVTDLESRLRNLRAAETQLLEIMDNATDSEDVINIFRELTNVRGEIELIEGQLKYYRESARLSAISVYLQAKAAVEPITIGGWQPGVEAQRALQALVEGGKYIVNALIWLIIFVVPILAIIILPIIFIVKAIRKRRMKKTNGENK